MFVNDIGTAGTVGRMDYGASTAGTVGYKEPKASLTDRLSAFDSQYMTPPAPNKAGHSLDIGGGGSSFTACSASSSGSVGGGGGTATVA